MLMSAQVLSSSGFFILIVSSLLSPVDCKVDDWSAWGDCNVTCGRGTRTKTREVIREGNHAGASCPALEKTEECNTEECPGTLFILAFFIFIFISLLTVDLQLTAKLAIGLHGVIAM